VGNQNGKLYRISNLALAYNFDRADQSSPSCIVSVENIPLYVPGTDEEISQVITSISVDPSNSNNVIVTLGNYGNDQYVLYSTNALSQTPEFVSKQGNLPNMPVYSSLLEMKDGNTAIIGTEHGIFSTSNITASSPNWEKDSDKMGSVPVFDLKQQLVGKKSMTVQEGNDEIVYEGASNKGIIYAATYGRGLFSSGRFWQPITDVKEINDNSSKYLSLNVYPNPAINNVNIEVEANDNSNATVNIYDLNGRLMVSKEEFLTKGLNNLLLDVSMLNNGTYLIKTVSEGTTYSNKLIIK